MSDLSNPGDRSFSRFIQEKEQDQNNSGRMKHDFQDLSQNLQIGALVQKLANLAKRTNELAKTEMELNIAKRGLLSHNIWRPHFSTSESNN